ncbi:MAG TPA: helix-turn-helix transcriptional regulator [Candidatus Acidoferrum sp.]|nr:helix-turn-helix transcriptional regulator [Candidatus Acidoferrum sp.]
MDGTGPIERAGAKLKQLRECAGLTLREVEAESRRLADQKKNQDFFISRGWLNNIENGTYKPSLFKLYTICAIYHVHWSTIFSFFGCDLGDFGRDQAMFAPPKTQLASDVPKEGDTIVVPLRSREDLRLDKTSLLSRLAEIWGEIPIRLIQHLDLRNGVYGFVGMSDRTMYPIIRPGSIVQIDQNQRKIIPKWQNEHERPIYFIELRGEYICSWCEMRDGYLSAVPHPNSECVVRRFSYPREADIVGRVIGVTMRIAEAA